MSHFGLGIPSLWSGLSASIVRQSMYSTARFGLYNKLAARAQSWTGQQKLSAAWTIACAGAAGGLAGLIGNPAEVVLVRMCADGAKAPAERFAYANALAGFYRIGRDEGLATFARGMSANVVRSILMSTVATTICAPADVLKSRIQSASAAGSGGNPVVQIIRTSLREEGPRFLMKGWTPAWLRLTPNTILTFVFMEQLRILTQWNFVPAGGAAMKI
ncbi:hypothetical protein ACHAPS_006581 [Verticillium nonalfalfae]